MTTLGSSSVESTMDNVYHTGKPRKIKQHKHQKPSSNDLTLDGEEGDPEVWKAFSRNFHQVQSVLDRNKVLIQQVNENHQSKIADNMVKNVALIQEINGNISKVASLYSDFSANFSSTCHQRTKNGSDGKNTGRE